MDLVILTENLPGVEKRIERKGEKRRGRGKREGTGTGTGREAGTEIGTGRGAETEIGTGTGTGGEAGTEIGIGRGAGTGSVIGMGRRKGTGTAITIIGIDTGIVVREGEGIEMMMIITETGTMTGKSLFGVWRLRIFISISP